ncbi:MAG: replicative DNA helicase [Candidatus Taylorbacteria bacterium]|nr:replicative DNA helicase [Candidatus Taylorbacteria bacterium]
MTASKKPSAFKVPPQNIESEKALLGAIMMRPGGLYEIIDVVTARSFYSEKHRIIFETMLELLSRNEPIDLLTMSAKLKEKSLIDAIGGSVYLTELINYVPSSANIRQYATIVHNKFLMRGLLDASEYISALGYDESSEVEDLLDRAEKKIFEVANFDRLDKLHKSKDELRGVPTGYRELDNKLAGFQKSDLIILAARPSMGKTSLALDIARQAAVIHNIPVCIFSLEMSSQQLVDRMLSAESRVDSWNIRTGKRLVDADFDRIRESLDRLSKAPIYVDDQPGNNIMKMRSVARRLKSEKNLGLIIVDYLQLMVPTQSRAIDSIVQQVTEISRSLKNMARELNVPVLALSQLSRAVEQRGGKPRLSDLRDSGSIEQDADVVMFIHRDDKYNDNSDKPNIAEILIEKHRNGPTGKAELYFDDKYTTFISLEKGSMSDFDAATATQPDDMGGF